MKRKAVFLLIVAFFAFFVPVSVAAVEDADTVANTDGITAQFQELESYLQQTREKLQSDNLSEEERAALFQGVFARAHEADGAFTELYALKICDIFEQSPEAFVNALALEEAETVQMVTAFLAQEKQYRDLVAYLEQIEQLLKSEELSGDDQQVLLQMKNGVVYLYAGQGNKPETYYELAQETFDRNPGNFIRYSRGYGKTAAENMADVLVYNRADVELTAFQSQIDELKTELADEPDLIFVLDLISDRIVAAQSAPVTELDSTEDSVPTTQPTVPETSAATDDAPYEEPQKPNWLPVVIAVAAVAAVTCFLLFQRKR